MAAPSQQDLAAGVPSGANIVARVPAPSGKGEPSQTSIRRGSRSA